MTTPNSYEDERRAAAYAGLEFPGTYFLAYRDLPALIDEYVRGRRAIDFGCGAGRSTRFLQKLGFAAIGVDISADMIDQAHELDPAGDYRLITAGDWDDLPPGEWDLVLAAFTFDNVPTHDQRAALMTDIAELLAPEGVFINLVSSPDIYLNEWASFSTRDFPENQQAGSGDPVKIIITGIGDDRPVVDIVCSDADYRDIHDRAGLRVITTRAPLGDADDGHDWVNEEDIAPWVIYLLGRDEGPLDRVGSRQIAPD